MRRMMTQVIRASLVLGLLTTMTACYGVNRPSQQVSPSAASEPAKVKTQTTTEPAAPGASDHPAEAVDTTMEQVAARMQRIFDSESRDSAWALDTEEKLSTTIEEQGGKEISPFICRATVCRGEYRFEPPMRFSLALRFLHRKLHFPYGVYPLWLDRDEKSGTVRVYIQKLDNHSYPVHI